MNPSTILPRSRSRSRTRRKPPFRTPKPPGILQDNEPKPDRILQFASLSFDAAVWDLVMSWRVGAELVLAAQHDLMPGEPLRELLLTPVFRFARPLAGNCRHHR